MTSTPTDTTTGTAVTPPPAPSVAKVLTALHRLGEATAAAIATEAGLGYSTTTPKLRTLETAGLAEPTRDERGRSLWRLTDTGRAHAEQGDEHGQPEPEPALRDAAAEPGPRGDDPQETGEATGQDHDQQPATEALADEQPDAAQAPTSPAANDVEVAVDEATETDDDETDDGGDSDRSTAEPEVPVTTDDTNPAIGTPPANEADPGQATPDLPPASTAADSTTGDAATEGSPAVPSGTEAAGEAAQAPTRRASGTLRGAILDILEANPGQRYKVSELCKLVDRANEGTGAKKASAGAVHNAAVKLVEAGRVVLAAEKPVTFALTDPAA
ncbi:MarR family winged helix-turn-helix transcriptional regulator [Micromonospora sp. C95]|uniref:MarR family winged helix-turn-helix transcriptional regulator n=1 Tax=Micromonospora sp. C95 TaxID=2824882 RepID=UPI001B37BAC6|nr:MarR family winged helix-turn-helix transcriptional regulator [Micromonospora sp. C95]MBQ1022909.1 MarR family transcriptional regulator [Micromonospora sp. C95]